MPSDALNETIKRCLNEFRKNEGRLPTIQELSAATAIGPGQLRSKIRRIIDNAQNDQNSEINTDDLKLVLKTVVRTPKTPDARTGVPAPSNPEDDPLNTSQMRQLNNTRVAHTDDLKEVRVSMQMKSADYQRKIDSARTFLLNGERVRISTMLTHNEIANPEKVMAVYDKILDDLGDVCLLEDGPQITERTISMILAPA